MISNIKAQIKRILMAHMDLKPLERFVSNINLDCTIKQKRVLITYLDFFRAGRDVEGGTVHTNRYELFQIIHCFIRLRYVIDVCSCEDMEAIPQINSKKYDVVLGMGEVFRHVVNQQKKTFSILYLTENPYDISCVREQERLDYLYERRGIKRELYRTGRVFKKDDEKKVNAVICMGNPELLRYVENPVKWLAPSGFRNEKFLINFKKKKVTNFLVLGTAGFVHKGIDLLVEVFEKHPSWNLFLCGHNNSKMMQELGYQNPYGNIHDCGYVDVSSELFRELVEKCVFILLPSCSEGVATAILTGMCHGMIPIISKEICFEFMTQYCLLFDSCRVEDIERKLVEASHIPEETLRERSLEIYQYANERFTLEKFTENMYNVLKSFLKEDINESSSS